MKTVAIPDNLHAELKTRAAQDGVTLAELASDLLARAVVQADDIPGAVEELDQAWLSLPDGGPCPHGHQSDSTAACPSAQWEAAAWRCRPCGQLRTAP